MVLVEPERERAAALLGLLGAAGLAVELVAEPDGAALRGRGRLPRVLVLGPGLRDSEAEELLRQVRAAPGGATPVVVGLCGRAEVGVQERAERLLAAGADELAELPAPPRRLALQLQSAPRRAAEREQALLLELGNDITAVLSADGILRAVSAAARRLLGREPQEWVGRSVFALIHPEDRDRVAAFLAERVRIAGPAPAIELRLAHGDGSWRWVEALGANLLEDPRVGGLVVNVRDVTARRQMAAQLMQADRLASVGLLAAGVAHEINNPLTYVLCHLEALATELPVVFGALERCRLALQAQRAQPGAAEALAALEQLQAREVTRQELQRLVAQAHEGASRVREIVRALRLFARTEPEESGPAEIPAALERTLQLVAPQVRYRARLVRELQPVPPVACAPARLEQVLLNLLVNAAQAIPEGAAERNQIRVRTWHADGQVAIEVADTGCGIGSEQLGRLFDPFFTTKPVGEGSGLGLSICHSIVTGAGGRIEVESELGAGARFTVWLPAALPDRLPPPAAPPTTPEVSPAAAVRPRVLVIDDEPMLLQAVARLLAEDYEVVTAESGEAAQALLQRDSRFDAVLCDVMMPEVSGMDLHAWLAAREPALAARMVFMTGGVFTERARSFLQALGRPWLDKPFDPAALRRLLGAVVRGEGAPGS